MRRNIKAVEQTKIIPRTAQEAIQQPVMANRILGNEGVLDALGHVSVRNPENVRTFFQARSISPYEVTKEDILEILWPKYISPEVAKVAMQMALFGPTPLARMWGYWVARVKRNMPDMKNWN